MKVIELQGRFGLDSLTVAERPQPNPGPGQALIRVRAVSLNFRDLLVATGSYDPKLRFPIVPTSDGAGEIAATGAGVTRVKVGDRVANLFMPGWVEGDLTSAKGASALGASNDGMAAEFVVLPETGV